MSTPVIRLLVSPAPSPSTPAARKVTPSAEQSSPKKALIVATPADGVGNTTQGGVPIQPFHAPRRLFPQGVATITHHSTHHHPAPMKQQQGAQGEEVQEHARHVLLPFDLRDPKLSISKPEVAALLHSIFPGTANVTQGNFRSHLLFQVQKLPRSPWPLTVGGLPITILDESDRGCAFLFPMRPIGNLAISICRNGHDFTSGLPSGIKLRKLFDEVNSEFQKNLPDIRIVEFMFASTRVFYVVLDDHVEIGTMRPKLPGKIANCPVMYLNDNEVCRPQWAKMPAKRMIEVHPLAGIADDTAYDILRPGVMICSSKLMDHAHPASLATTTGILVKNAAGDTFMTGASHRIGPLEEVWQPGRRDKVVGKAAVEITHTDVSLIALSQGVEFINETFEDAAGVVPNFSHLVTSEEEPQSPFAYLNSPFSGNMEAVIVMRSVRAPSTLPQEAMVRNVLYDWSYWGQEEGNENKARPVDGTCGSVIWDDDGIIRGFYRYYIEKGKWAGFSISVCASEVVDAGYTLAK